MHLKSSTIEQYQGWLRRLARTLVCDGSQAEDLAQQVWLQAMRAKSPPREGEDPRPWLKAVARNTLINFRRSDLRRATRERKYPKLEEYIETSFHQREETRATVEKFVAALEEPYRSVIRLRFHEELSVQEIARKKGVPFDTAKTQLRRALDQLRRMLDRRYGSREVWGILLLPLCPLGLPQGGPAPSRASAPQAGTAKAASVSAKWAFGLSAAVLLSFSAAPFIGMFSEGDSSFTAPQNALSSSVESQLRSADGAPTSSVERSGAPLAHFVSPPFTASSEEAGNEQFSSMPGKSATKGKRKQTNGMALGPVIDLTDGASWAKNFTPDPTLWPGDSPDGSPAREDLVDDPAWEQIDFKSKNLKQDNRYRRIQMKQRD